VGCQHQVRSPGRGGEGAKEHGACQTTPLERAHASACTAIKARVRVCACISNFGAQHGIMWKYMCSASTPVSVCLCLCAFLPPHCVVCQQLHNPLVELGRQPVFTQLRLQRVRQRTSSIGQGTYSSTYISWHTAVVVAAAAANEIHQSQSAQSTDRVCLGVVSTVTEPLLHGALSPVPDSAMYQQMWCTI